METIRLAQALHGYDQGHRLLAEGGDLSHVERTLLDRLSDLSGYLPPGASFDNYLTGFTCMRYYALMRTWPDVQAARGGTVLSHTLLLPLDSLDRFDDLAGLADLHRRPDSADDLEPYRCTLEVSLAGAPPSGADILDQQRARAALTLLFGQPERPILWQEVGSAEAMVRYLWLLLWPEARREFSFCCFALQPRKEPGGQDPFDLLAMPREARGAFYEMLPSRAWWIGGRLEDEGLQEISGRPWIDDLLSRGREAVDSLIGLCRRQNLPLPAVSDLPVLWRFVELRPDAGKRITAARARADLMDRLWPDLSAMHPLWQETLRQLVHLQADAALKPRPLWELGDLLARPQLGELVELNQELADVLERVVDRELARRLEHFPGATARGLPGLIGSTGSGRLGREIYRSVGRVVSNSGGRALEIATELIIAAAGSKDAELMRCALAGLSSGDRPRAVRAASDSAARDRLEVMCELAGEAAEDLRDPLLAFGAWECLGRPLDGLQMAARIVLSAESSDPETLVPLLAAVDPGVRLRWAVEVDVHGLYALAAAHGSGAAGELGLSPTELARTCSGEANGARVFIAHAMGLQETELARAVAGEPRLALEIILAALDDGLSPYRHPVVVDALEALPGELLLDDRLLGSLSHTKLPIRLPGLPARIGPALINALCAEEMSPEEAAGWLSLSDVRDWLSRSGRWKLYSGLPDRRPGAGCLAPLVKAVEAALGADPEQHGEWVTGLLGAPLERTGMDALEMSIQGLSKIIELSRNMERRRRLAALVKDAVTRLVPPSGYVLMELCVPILDAGRRRRTAERTVLGWRRFLVPHALVSSPDWLVDLWIRGSWPPESFLRALAGDEELFYDLADHARSTRSGEAFLCSMPEALEREPDLSGSWRGPVRQVLSRVGKW